MKEFCNFPLSFSQDFLLSDMFLLSIVAGILLPTVTKFLLFVLSGLPSVFCGRVFLLRTQCCALGLQTVKADRTSSFC
jgi:hypothetical protein